MILGAFIIVTIPAILSIIFPERNMDNWNEDTNEWDEEKMKAYNLKKRIIYGNGIKNEMPKNSCK